MPKVLPVVTGEELLELLLEAAVLEEELLPWLVFWVGPVDELVLDDWLTELLLAAPEEPLAGLLDEEVEPPPHAVSTAVESATIGRIICR